MIQMLQKKMGGKYKFAKKLSMAKKTQQVQRKKIRLQVQEKRVRVRHRSQFRRKNQLYQMESSSD